MAIINRKDIAPDCTIDKICSILQNLGINYSISDYKNYNNAWHSLHVSIDGFSGVGTNGKGISYEFALASALAELMERLQGEFLMHDLYRSFSSQTNSRILEGNDTFIINTYSEFFANYFKSNKCIEDFIQEFSSFKEMKKYSDLFSDKEIYLPEKFIKLVCGTNGLCAGNSKDEAIAQGICEVLERYVISEIYNNQKKYNIFNIPIKSLKHLESHKLLMKISDLGYTFQVKDCSLENRFPAIGLVVYNKTRTKSTFCVGCDVNMDIALQRAITEMFQGISIGYEFNSKMVPFDISDFEDEKKIMNELRKQVEVGKGALPTKVYFCNDNKELQNLPFDNSIITSKDAINYLKNILKKLNYNISVSDYSYLGFDTFRVYIHGITDIYKINYVELIKKNFNLKKSVFSGDFLNNEKFSKMLIDSVDMFEYATPCVSFGINLLDANRFSNWYNLASNLLIQKKDYTNSCLIKNIQILKSVNVKTNLTKERYILYALSSGISLKMIQDSGLFSIHDFEFLNEKISLPTCPNCECCELTKICNYNSWEFIMNKIIEKQKDHNENLYIRRRNV